MPITLRIITILAWLAVSGAILVVRTMVLVRLNFHPDDRGIRYLRRGYIGMGIFETCVMIVCLLALFDVGISATTRGIVLLILFSVGFFTAELSSLFLSFYLLRVFEVVPESKQVTMTGPPDPAPPDPL